MYRKSQTKMKICKVPILLCMGSTFCALLHKILNPYTAKYTFYEVLSLITYDISRVMISYVLVRQAPEQLLNAPEH